MTEEVKKDPVASLAGQIRHTTTGQRSQLKRMDLTRSVAADAILIGMLVKAGIDAAVISDADMEAWRTMAFATALISGTGGTEAHNPSVPMGRALARAGYSATRLERLAGTTDPVQVRRALRFLAGAKVGAFDMREVRALVGPDQHLRQRAVKSLVRSFHTANYDHGERDDPAA